MPPQSTDPAALVTVHVTCNESVVAGGTRTTQWQVRDGNVWVAAHRHPSCVGERGKSAPGLVWQELLTLQLLPGSELKQVISEPLPAKPRSAFDYLQRPVRNPPRRTRELHYTVDSTGLLQRKDV
jgi:hypothetical protein